MDVSAGIKHPHYCRSLLLSPRDAKAKSLLDGPSTLMAGVLYAC
jgi:hypothetical protein